jgi:hypothetical protein
MNHNVLISSAGRRIGLLECMHDALKGTGRIGIIDCSPTAPAARLADVPGSFRRAIHRCFWTKF